MAIYFLTKEAKRNYMAGRIDRKDRKMKCPHKRGLTSMVKGSQESEVDDEACVHPMFYR
jgi:hypothetical protein